MVRARYEQFTVVLTAAGSVQGWVNQVPSPAIRGQIME